MQNKVIFTIFAGRKSNLEILFSYLETLYKSRDIDEVHVWNFTREVCDEEYIKEYLNNFNIKKVYDGETIEFRDNMIIDKYRLNIKDKNLVISYINNNSETVIQSIVFNSKEKIKIRVNKNIKESYFTVTCDNDACNIFTSTITDHMIVKYPDWKLFNLENKKSWAEYYYYYSNQKDYSGDDVIIKCDDDIVFIDTLQFKTFIKRRIENQKYMLFFPNIINNGVIAYHQSKMELIPMDMPYDTFYGKLVNDGMLANDIHAHFCNNTISYLTKSRNIKNVISHKIGDRISINFFAILAKHIFVYREVGWDDEHDITVTIPNIHNWGIGIDMSMTVSHLGFSPQRKTGLNETLLIDMYKKVGNITNVTNVEKPKIEILKFKNGKLL